MEITKRERNIENYIIRNIPDRSLDEEIDTNAPDYYYGKIPDFKINDNWELILDDNNQPIPNTVDINIFLTQDYDDMGIFIDAEFTYSGITLNPPPPTTYPPVSWQVGGVPPLVPMGPFNSFVYGRLPGAPLDFFIPPQLPIAGDSDDSNIDTVQSYKKVPVTNTPIFNPGLNLAEDITLTFNGVVNTGVNSVTYVIGADPNNILTTGVHFVTFKNIYVDSTDDRGKPIRYKKTNFSSEMPGITNKNVVLSALTKQEEYLGIVFKPEVESEVFIDRGVADIFEKHAMLSEIKSTNDIDNNRGGFLST